MTQLAGRRDHSRVQEVSISAPGQQPPRSDRLSTWLKNTPFALLHLGPLAALFTGVDSLSIDLCGGVYLLQMVGVTAGYHRYFAHRSFKTSRAFQFVLAWLGCSAGQ